MDQWFSEGALNRSTASCAFKPVPPIAHAFHRRIRTPLAREIYYLSENRKLMAVPVGDGPSFGIPKPLFQTRVPAGINQLRTNYVPSRDGQRFLINTLTGDPVPTPITVVLNWTAGLKK